MFLVNTDTKIFNKILLKPTQAHIKKIIHHDQVGFTPGMQGWFNLYRVIFIIQHIHRKNSMIISHYREKASDKAQHPFTIKVPKKGIQETHINTIKVTYDKSIANVMPSEGKLRALPLKFEPKEGCLLVYFYPR